MTNVQLYKKENYNQALTMIKTSYPLCHVHIANILDCIGGTVNQQNKYDEACNFHY